MNDMLKAARSKQVRRRVLALFSAAILILTTNQLKMRADTIEHLPACGYVEHQHSEECLDEAGNIVCGLNEHVHTDACFQERPKADEVMPEVDLPIEETPLEMVDEDLVVSSEIEAPVEETDSFDLGEPEETKSETGEEATGLVVEDFETPVYDFNGASYALLSDILARAGLDIDKNEIDEVGESVADDNQQLSISVVKDEDEYTITALRDFIDDDMVELVVFTKDGGVHLVNLKNGIEYESAEWAVDEEQSASLESAPVDDEEQPSVAAAEDEENAEDQPVPVESAPVEGDEQTAVEATEQPSAPVEDEASEPVIEQTDGDSEATAEPTAEPAPDSESTDEQSAADNSSTATVVDIEETVTENRGTEDLPQEVVEDEKHPDEAVEDEKQPEEAVEDEEQPEEAVEDEEQPDEAVTDEGEEKSEESVTENEEQPGEDAEDEKQPDEAVTEADEQPEESVPEAEEKPEEAAGDEVEEQPEESVTEAEEQPDETPVVVYTATVDLTDRAAPFSVVEMMGAAAPAEDLSAQEEQQAEEALDPSDWTLEYDEELLEVVFEDGDYLITPKASFEAATIFVGAGDSYVLNLVNCQLPLAYPARSFEGSTATMTVKVTADEGAFPEGTTMEVADVEDEATISDIAGAVEGENVTVNRVHAVDITFRDGKGEEIEPLIPISVVMSVNEQAQSADAVVVHVDGEGNAEVLEQTGEGSEVAFDAEAFSVYAIVITEKYISANGEKYNIQLSYDSKAGIPDGAALRVVEVEDQEYLDRASEAVGADKAVRLARFFDISIMADGREIQPVAPVAVQVSLEEDMEAAIAEVRALHFDADEVELIHTVHANGSVYFNAEGFSVYGIVYTVDFEYTDEEGTQYTWQMQGGGSMKLSTLLKLLHIGEDLTDSQVRFTAPNLVEFEPVTEGETVVDWTINSLEPFDTEETLYVTLRNGKTLVIRVTDAQEINIQKPEITLKLLRGAKKTINPDTGEGEWVWSDLENAEADHAFEFRVNYSFSTDTVSKRRWEIGQIEMRIPKSILVDRDGNPADEYQLSVPREDADGLSRQNVFVYREEGDEIVIYNRVQADPTQVGYFEIAYTTTEQTFAYVDYLSEEEHEGSMPMRAELYVYNEKRENNATVVDREASPLTHQFSDEIEVHIDTTAEIIKTDKKNPKAFTAWNNAWGDKPTEEAGKDYVYVLWTVESVIEATQPFDFRLDDSFTTSDASITGEVVGYRLVGQSIYSQTNEAKSVVANKDGKLTRVDYVLTRHDLSAFKADEDKWNAGVEYFLNNDVTATVVPVDGVDMATQVQDSEAFSDKKPSYTPPAGGGFNPAKTGYPVNYELSKFIESPDYSIRDLCYDVTLAGNGWYYTYQFIPTDKVVVDPGRDTHEGKDYYGNKAVTYTIHDNKLWIEYKDQSAVSHKSNQLVSGDYEISAIDFSYAFRQAFYNDAEMRWGAGADMTAAQISAMAVENPDKLGDLVFKVEQNGAPIEGEICYSLANGSYHCDAALSGIFDESASTADRLVFKDGSDITGYTLENSNKLYYTRLKATPHVTLKHSASNESVLEPTLTALKTGLEPTDAPAMMLFNEADYHVDDTWTATRWAKDDIVGDCRRSKLTKGYTKRRNDTVRSLYYIDWLVNMQETNTVSGEESYVPQQFGTFRDLLPVGNEYVADTLVVYADGEPLDAGQYRATIDSDYNGTGRALLTVEFNAKADETYAMAYQTSMTWNAILEQRKDTGENETVKAHNAVAYITGNDSISAFDYDQSGLNPDDKTALGTHDPNEESYKDISIAYNCPVTALVSGTLGLQKLVRATDISVRYEKSAWTYAGGEYSYRITFGPNEGTEARSLAVYDFLENWQEGEEHSLWYGTLKSVDTSLASLVGVKPVVYYTNTPREMLKEYQASYETDENHPFKELTGAGTIWTPWGENGPEDLSAVTGIAVDFSKDTHNGDFILKGGKTLTLTVYLNAPASAVVGEDGSVIANAMTYNEVYLRQDLADESDTTDTRWSGEQVIQQGHTEVQYRVVGSLRLRKTSSLSPNEGIRNVTFQITGTSAYGTQVDSTATSAEGGWVTFPRLEMTNTGEYYLLREIEGVEDYVLDETAIQVGIGPDGKARIIGAEDGSELTQVFELSEDTAAGEGESVIGKALPTEEERTNGTDFRVTNKPRVHGNLEFTKKGRRDGSDALNALEGTSFRLYSNPTTFYGKTVDMTAVSDASGKVTFENVERGTYILEEQIPTDGYILANRTFTVTCDENGKLSIARNDEGGHPLADPAEDTVANVALTIENLDASAETDMTHQYTIADEPLHSLGLFKVDNMSGKVLQGARFNLKGTA